MNISNFINQVHHSDCIELMSKIPNNSVHTVLIDPPYELLNHKIEDEKPSYLEFAKQAYRITKPNSFFIVFGVQPTIDYWKNALYENGYKFHKEIIWCKRTINVSASELQRTHENIFVFKKGNPKFNIIKCNYADIAYPETIDGLRNIETTFRQLAELKSALNGKELRVRVSGTKRNDLTYNRMANTAEKTSYSDELKLRSIWSFLPHNRANYNREDSNVKHPTVKPIPLIQRLLQVYSNENDVIFDGYAGSGTTALACIKENRQYITCEKNLEYFELSKNRIDKQLSVPELFYQ